MDHGVIGPTDGGSCCTERGIGRERWCREELTLVVTCKERKPEGVRTRWAGVNNVRRYCSCYSGQSVGDGEATGLRFKLWVVVVVVVVVVLLGDGH